jgi:hypothetical protein
MAAAVARLAALAACFGGLSTILGEIARVVVRAAATVAVLAALSTCFSRAFAIIGEVSAAVLTADVPGARGLLAVLGEIARITGVSLFSHLHPLSLSQWPDHSVRSRVNGRDATPFVQTFREKIGIFLISNATAVSLGGFDSVAPGDGTA